MPIPRNVNTSPPAIAPAVTTNNFYANGSGYGMVEIRDDEIYLNNALIGVTTALYDSAVDKGLNWKQLLIEAGLIEVEKTAEEIIAEQAELLKQATEKMTMLLDRIESLEGVTHGRKQNETGSQASVSGNNGSGTVGKPGGAGSNTDPKGNKQEPVGERSEQNIQ